MDNNSEERYEIGRRPRIKRDANLPLELLNITSGNRKV